MNRINRISAVGSASRGVAGSALVSTLLMIVVLTIIVTAFIQSMAVERRTANSYKNKLQADLAADAGISAFIQSLEVADLEEGYITILDSPAQSGDEPGALIRVYDKHTGSEAQNIRLESAPLPAQTQPASENRTIDINGPSISKNAFTTEVATGSIPKYPAGAVTIQRGPNRFVQYAYRAVDESGKLNPLYHGIGYTADQRTGIVEGDNLKEIAISGLTSTTPPGGNLKDSTASALKLLPIKTNGAYQSLGQAFENAASHQEKKHLVTFHEGETIEWIPKGIFDKDGNWVALADGGKPKYDINQLATDSNLSATARVDSIADIIDKNIPKFKGRDQAFVESGATADQIRYVRRIAAGIVSYISSLDPVVTLADGEPAGRGLVAFPYKICEKYEFVSVVGSPGNWQVNLDYSLFVELWNPNTKPVSGIFGITLTSMRVVQIPGAVQAPFDPFSGSISVSLGPNEVKVYPIGTQIRKTISVPNTAAPTAASMVTTSSGDSDPNLGHSRYTATWNGVVYDYTPNARSPMFEENGPGLRKNAVTLNSTNKTAYAVNLQQTPNAASFRSVGDPRLNYSTNYVWEAPAATNASLRWNGRGTWGITSPFTQDYALTWAKRDGMRVSPAAGNSRTASQDPDQVSSNYSLSSATAKSSPIFVRAGKMVTVAELGNIFDPVHLNDRGFTSNGSNPGNFFSSGGGRTLRIGREEFAYPETTAPTPSSSERRSKDWTEWGYRATDLLDLFTTVPLDSTDLPRSKGRININTAHRDVLASVFFDITLMSDEGLTPPPKVTSEGAYKIADEVIKNRPYTSASDLQKVMYAFDNRFKGSDASFSAFSPDYAQSKTDTLVMDRIREELFARTYDTFSFSGAAYKIVSVGLVRKQPSGSVIATSAVEALVELRVIGSQGAFSLKPVVVNRRNIY